jgi:hypothetical protein
MEDTTPANDSNDSGLNKIDLSQLQAFSFGTQWTEVKPISPARRERDFDRGDRGDRGDRRPGGGGQGAPSRDRRSFQKPAGPAPTGGAAPAAGAPPREGQPPQGDRRRYDGPGPGGDRRRDFRGDDRREGGGHPADRAPYFSPYFTATCYPEDTGFAAMVKAVRASCRTYQLFEITKAVLEKSDRFVVVLQRARPERPNRPAEGAAEGSPAPASEKANPLYMSLPDYLPFDTEEAAIQHVLANNLGAFFEMQEVEVEAPKGNFPIINKCGITGELLGPPNHHRYQQILQQHHAAKLGRMPFERFRESIISAREPEVIAAWMDKMKKATRYTWRPPVAKSATTPPMETAAPVAAAAAPVETPAAEVASAPAPETPAPLSFDNFEDARLHLISNARDKMVRAVESVRFQGKMIEKLPPGEIRRALEGHVERQRRFPLDTANALRGRLRREGFTIFKKGSRGVSYVCAVKRRFRVPGQVFSETITKLIDFIEKNAMVHMKDLPKNFLGLEVPVAAPAAPVAEGAAPAPAAPALTPAQAEILRKMSNDLRWLVMEGYVTEFSDGKLFAPPPMAPQAAKRAESGEDEHDPVDFPDAPAASAEPAAVAGTAMADKPADMSAPVAADVAPAAEVPAPAAAAPEVAPAAPAVAAAEVKPAEEPKPEGQV